MVFYCLYPKFAISSHVRYDLLPVSSIEQVVFVAPDADNSEHSWAVVDMDFCPWTEHYADGAFDDAIAVSPFPDAAPSGSAGVTNDCGDMDSEQHDDGSSESEDEFQSDEEDHVLVRDAYELGNLL